MSACKKRLREYPWDEVLPDSNFEMEVRVWEGGDDGPLNGSKLVASFFGKVTELPSELAAFCRLLAEKRRTLCEQLEEYIMEPLELEDVVTHTAFYGPDCMELDAVPVDNDAYDWIDGAPSWSNLLRRFFVEDGYERTFAKFAKKRGDAKPELCIEFYDF
jgi:hypothetical protein